MKTYGGTQNSQEENTATREEGIRRVRQAEEYSSDNYRLSDEGTARLVSA